MINIDSFWENCLNILSAKVVAIGYEVWVQKLRPVCFIKNTLILSTTTQVAKRTTETRYLDTILEAVQEVNPLIATVEIITEDRKEEYLARQDDVLDGEIVVRDDSPRSDQPLFAFNKKYTFDRFVVGKSNEFAAAAATAVAETPGSNLNPLFIYGGVGLGKTHIMHAIGNHIIKNSPQLRVMYVSTNSFFNEFLDVIRHQRSDPDINRRFREKYREVDVLMMDDIQYASGQDAVQEVIFHIFNDLYQLNKQIIFSSDRPPKDLAKLSERLRTRFAWGLTVEIQPPDLTTRIAILDSKAKEQNFVLETEVATFIAENSESNIRDMEGLLNKVIFYSSLSGRKVDSIASAREALKDSISMPKETVDAEDIIFYTCKYYNISTSEIKGKKRNREFVEPRMIAIYLITEFLSLPLVAIGEYFGGRDHTTIIHARDKIADALTNNDLSIKKAVRDISDAINHR